MGKKNKKQGHPLNTGDRFIQEALVKGAHVESHGIFNKITTPMGSMFIKPGRVTLDDKTIGNTKRWFKLLGLLVLFLGIPVWLIFFSHLCLDLTSTLRMCSF